MARGVIVAAAVAASVSALTAAASLAASVKTTIGAGGVGYGIGSLNPGPQVPFGAMRLGPDTIYVDPLLGPLWLAFNHFGGYYAGDTHVMAFSHTHMVGSGATDWGNHGFMVSRWLNASTVDNSAAVANYRSGFTHTNETATAGFYGVQLTDAATLAELTVSGTHSGIHRYTCAATSDGLPCTLLLDVCHTANAPGACKQAGVTLSVPAAAGGGNGSSPVIMEGAVLNAGGLSGRGVLGGVWVYVYAEVTAAASGGGSSGNGTAPYVWGAWNNNILQPGFTGSANTTTGSLGLYATWHNTAGVGSATTLTVRVGLSFVDVAHAKANLYAEQYAQPGYGAGWMAFDDVRARTTAEWESWLQRFQVTFPSDMQPDDLAGNQTVFTTAVYHSLLAPTTYSEPSDGSYVGMDNAVHVAAPGSRYMSDMSIWDIHRSQAPFLNTFVPDVAKDVTDSLVLMFNQGGRLARWPLASVFTGCMDGSHAAIIMGDQLAKQVPGVSAANFLPAVSNALSSQDAGSYSTLGYVPIEESDHAVTSTLEYAYDDGIAALIAAAAGDTASAAAWSQRAQNYRNVFNANTTFMCPRYANGTWSCPVFPALPYPFNNDYLEGDAEQYQTFVPHDQAGLVSIFPSVQSYVDALTTLQAKQTEWIIGNALPNPYYWAGNEPDLLAPWQFAAAGNQFASLTQYWTRFILARYYTTQPDGIPGNDDFGTMSAWAVWAYLGLYPIAGLETYALGSPFFANATVAIPAESFRAADASDPRVTAGATLQIIAHNASASNIYAYAAAANGVKLATAYVNHTQLWPAGTANALLEFWMTDAPQPFGA